MSAPAPWVQKEVSGLALAAGQDGRLLPGCLGQRGVVRPPAETFAFVMAFLKDHLLDFQAVFVPTC